MIDTQSMSKHIRIPISDVSKNIQSPGFIYMSLPE
jgi:hypothetical protein